MEDILYYLMIATASIIAVVGLAFTFASAIMVIRGQKDDEPVQRAEPHKRLPMGMKAEQERQRAKAEPKIGTSLAPVSLSPFKRAVSQPPKPSGLFPMAPKKTGAAGEDVADGPTDNIYDTPLGTNKPNRD